MDKKTIPILGSYSFLRLYILIPGFSVFSGGLIYILFRSGKPLFIQGLNYLGIELPLSFLRQKLYYLSTQLPEWIVYSLPNALWAFAYAFVITSIWSRNQSYQRYCWMASVPILILGHELLQYIEVLPGTFCPYDLIFGTVGMIIGFFIPSQLAKTKNHEKNT